MLFVAVSHKLSSYIFALNERTKKLSPKERDEIKEPINPEARFVLLAVAISTHLLSNHVTRPPIWRVINSCLILWSNLGYLQWWNEWLFICSCRGSLSQNFQITYWGDGRYNWESSHVNSKESITIYSISKLAYVYWLTSFILFLFHLSVVQYTNFQILNGI